MLLIAALKTFNMNMLKTITGNIISILVVLLIFWLIDLYKVKEPLAVAPDMHMVIECDSFDISLHVSNPSDQTIKYSYRIYVDSNSNQTLDSSDIFMYGQSDQKVRGYDETEGMVMRPLDRYKYYPLLAELKTDKLVEYYLTMGCESIK